MILLTFFMTIKNYLEFDGTLDFMIRFITFITMFNITTIKNTKLA